MVPDSHPWKVALSRIADDLERRATRTRRGARAEVALEQQLAAGAYALRKLLENGLLSRAVEKRPLPMQAYPYHHASVELSHWRDFRQHYQMAKPRMTRHPPLFLCHQLLDSAVLQLESDGGRTPGWVYVTSDHQKHKALYRIAMADIIQLLRAAAG
jgi:hypothetical protein